MGSGGVALSRIAATVTITGTVGAPWGRGHSVAAREGETQMIVYQGPVRKHGAEGNRPVAQRHRVPFEQMPIEERIDMVATAIVVLLLSERNGSQRVKGNRNLLPRWRFQTQRRDISRAPCVCCWRD